MNPDSKIIHWIEQWTPLVCAVLASAIYSIWFPNVLSAAADTFSSVTNVGGIAVGFLGTSQAFVFSMPRSSFVNRLRQLGAFPKLLSFFSKAIWLSLGTTFFSLTLTMICPEKGASNATQIPQWLMVLWVFCTVWAIVATVRVIYLSDQILRVAFSEQS